MSETVVAQRCVSCGYDLAGLADPGVCPECAKPFDTHAAGERISEPWPCMRCGYPLLDHRRLDRCSECGNPVRFSLRSTLLRFQPAAYRTRLRSGAFYAALGMAFAVVVPIFFGLISQVWFPMINLELLAMGTIIIALGPWAFGWMRVFTKPPEAMEFTKAQQRVRVIARGALLVVAAVISAALIVGPFVATRAYSPGSTTAIVTNVIGTLFIVSIIVFFYTSTWTVMVLLIRARSAKHRPSASAVVAMIIGTITVVCLLGAYITESIAANSQGVYAMHIGAATTVLGIVAGIGSVVLFFAVLLMLGRLSGAVKRVGHEVASVARHSRLRREMLEKQSASPDPPKYAQD